MEEEKDRDSLSEKECKYDEWNWNGKIYTKKALRSYLYYSISNYKLMAFLNTVKINTMIFI